MDVRWTEHFSHVAEQLKKAYVAEQLKKAYVAEQLKKAYMAEQLKKAYMAETFCLFDLFHYAKCPQIPPFSSASHLMS